MAELDDQLARLAAQRADAVPPLDPAAARTRARRNARRRAAWVSGIAACIVALLAAGGFALAGGSGDSPSVHTPANSTEAPALTTAPSTTVLPTTTVPPTTVPVVPSCTPLDGADTAPKHGPASERAALESTEVIVVQVETNACVDSLRIAVGPTPGWSAFYEHGPDGAIRLVLSLASGSVSEYAAPMPDDLVVGPPSVITRVQRSVDPVGRLSWTIGVADELPFRVVVADGSMDVEFASSEHERTVTCAVPDEHFEYMLPDGWVVDVAPKRCERFASEPFRPCSGCDGPFPYGTIGLSTDNLDPGPWNVVLSSTETTVGGRPATVRELESTGRALRPAGYRTYEYIVDWAPEGTLVISIGGDPGFEFDAQKAGLDAVAASVRRIE